MYVLEDKIMLCRDDGLSRFNLFAANHMRWDNFSVTYVD